MNFNQIRNDFDADRIVPNQRCLKLIIINRTVTAGDQ
jgi:hypothetical protein